MATDEPLMVLYPEIAAGGYSRVDGTMAFYVRVGALLTEAGSDAVVVDFGAGRGAFVDQGAPAHRDARLLRGRAGRVIGIDVDKAVLDNPAVDEAHVVRVGESLPVVDGTVDLVVSDYVFEHIADPAWAAGEIGRILRPGGWLCARTPNRWGYIGLGARAVPNSLHVGALRRLQPQKPAEDTFPTTYLLNTPAALRRWFPPNLFHHVVWAMDNEPAYVGHSLMAAKMTKALFNVTPPRLRSVLLAFLQKRPQSTDREGQR